ncbi:MAG: GNAT family N-acetyltransferase [Acidimicrobiia bacterium]
MEPLLHLTTASVWRAALSLGTLATQSLVTEGFIHLSGPDQVAGVADLLFAGRDDLLMLVVDPDRLTDEVRWESGLPTDPPEKRFPHLYGVLPTAAVTSVLPYRPGPESRFPPAVGLPRSSDFGFRAAAFDRSLGQRRAPVLIPVAGGVAALDPRVAESYEHNSLWVTDDVDADTLRSEADRVMSAYSHRQVVLDRPPPAGLDWAVDEERLLALDPAKPTPPPGATVVAVTTEVMAGLWRPSWFRDLESPTEHTVDQLILREPLNDVHVRIIDLAVLGDDGVPVAGTQLRIDGATAAIEAVMTAPDARGRGHAGALVSSAILRARDAGCDCIFLFAVKGDWPLDWYQRLGFVDVGARWVATQENVTPMSI